MWHDSATRQAVVAAAESTTSAGQQATNIEDVARTTDRLKQLALPVGWNEPIFDSSHDGGWWISHVIGWILTGALLMLGAPFWFDLLSRLVSLRNSGQAPAAAANDNGSATSALLRGLAGLEPDGGGPSAAERGLSAGEGDQAAAREVAAPEERVRGLPASLAGLLGTSPPAQDLPEMPKTTGASNVARRLAGR
jgi:hypothetical protein